MFMELAPGIQSTINRSKFNSCYALLNSFVPQKSTLHIRTTVICKKPDRLIANTKTDLEHKKWSSLWKMIVTRIWQKNGAGIFWKLDSSSKLFPDNISYPLTKKEQKAGWWEGGLSTELICTKCPLFWNCIEVICTECHLLICTKYRVVPFIRPTGYRNRQNRDSSSGRLDKRPSVIRKFRPDNGPLGYHYPS